MARTKVYTASWKLLVIVSLLLGLVDWQLGCPSFLHCNRHSGVATALFFDSTATTRQASCPPMTMPTRPPPPTISERLLDLFLQGASTMETMFRGFSLGFGIRMLKYILLESDGQIDEYMTKERIQKRLWMSCICGMAMASFIHGLSLFVPTQLRMNWFENQ